MTQPLNTRRDFVKKAVYATPAVITLAAVPSYAKAGSVKQGDDNGNSNNNGNNGNNGNSNNSGNNGSSAQQRE